MNAVSRTITIWGHQIDVSGLVWVHPDPKALDLSLSPVVMPGGYPSPLGASTIDFIRTALENRLDDGLLGWPTGISYVSAWARLAEWLHATGRVAPGGRWDLSDLDLPTARAFLAYAKEGWSKGRFTAKKAALCWAYDQAILQGRSGYSGETLKLLKSVEHGELGTAEAEGGVVPVWSLPAEPELPAVPTSFECKGAAVSIEGLGMSWAKAKATIRLERIVRPAGRPSVLSRRAQQVVLLYTVEEITTRTWSRHQIVNAVDRFGQWLAWHPEWAACVEGFDWSDFGADLAEAYYDVVRGEPKGNDWWIFLRGLYRWGLSRGFDGFDQAVERELMAVGNGRALTVHPSGSTEDVTSRFVPDPGLPPIPPEFRTRDQKHIVRTGSPIWRQHNDSGQARGTTVNLALLDDPPEGPQEAIYTCRFLHLIRLYVVQQASKRWSWDTAGPFIAMLRHLQSWLLTHREQSPNSFDVQHLTHTLLASHQVYLESNEGPGHSGMLSMLRGFYRWGVKKRLPGFDRLMLERLEELAFKNAPKGELIRAVDPREGALSMAEQKAVKRALEVPDWGTAEEKALVKLCWYLGPRPVQIAALKVKHFVKHVTPHGITYIILVPRAKKRYATEETVARAIPTEYGLGQLLDELCPPGVDPERALFPSLADRLDAAACVNPMLKRWAHRSGPRPLRTARIRRDGEPIELPIYPYRFRRTMATNMARQGASAEHVAHMLDDDDIRMALVYTENVGEIVRVLGETLDAGEYLDIIGGYLGEYETEKDRSLPVIQPVAVDGPGRETLLDLGGTGRCGAGALCNLAWPFSCYSCSRFKPRPGGPHEQMLANVDQIIAEHRARRQDRMVIIHLHIREEIAIVVEDERRRTAASQASNPNGDSA